MTTGQPVTRETDQYGNIRVSHVEVRHVSYPIYVTSAGTFLAYLNGDRIDAQSLDQLRKILLASSKLAAFNIPFWIWEADDDETYGRRAKKGSWKKALLIGLHANDNAIYRVEGEKGTKQARYYSDNDAFRGDMPDDVRTRYAEIIAEERRLDAEKEKISDKWRQSLKDLAKEAIANVAGTGKTAKS